MEINSKIEAANEIMGIIAKRGGEILDELKVVSGRLTEIKEMEFSQIDQNEMMMLIKRADNLKAINDFYNNVVKTMNEDLFEEEDPMKKLMEMIFNGLN